MTQSLVDIPIRIRRLHKIEATPPTFLSTPPKMSTPLCRETTKALHAELDAALQSYRQEIVNSTLAPVKGLDAAIRICEKLKHFLADDFHSLWLMEWEERKEMKEAAEERDRKALLASCRSRLTALQWLRAAGDPPTETSPLAAALRAMQEAPKHTTTSPVSAPMVHPGGDLGADEDLYS